MFDYSFWLWQQVSIDALLVLSGAVLTSYVGVLGLVRRMALDRCLPQFLLQRNELRDTNHFIIVGFFLLTSSLLILVGGDTTTIAGVYTIAFLGVMCFFSVSAMLLKFKRLGEIPFKLCFISFSDSSYSSSFFWYIRIMNTSHLSQPQVQAPKRNGGILGFCFHCFFPGVYGPDWKHYRGSFLTHFFFFEFSWISIGSFLKLSQYPENFLFFCLYFSTGMVVILAMLSRTTILKVNKRRGGR